MANEPITADVTNLTSPVEVLIQYFENTGWHPELSEQKVRSRGHVNRDESGDPDLVIVEIERHRAALGDQYIRGCSMSVYRTYYMRYLVDCRRGVVESLEDKMGNLNIKDVYRLAENYVEREFFDLRVTAVSARKFEISDLVSKEKAIIRSEAEAIEFANSFLNSFVDYFRSRLSDEIESSEADSNRVDFFTREFSSILSKLLISKAQEAWRKR